MTTLTPTERQRLLDVADRESVGGVIVPFVRRGDLRLKEAGLLWINGTRLRCTHEGLAMAKRIREGA